MTNQPLASELAMLLERIDDLIGHAHRLPWTGRILIDANELATLVAQVQHVLPEEVRQAQWIVAERDRILKEAMDQAQSLKQEAQKEISRQADGSEVVARARERAQELTDQARQAAREIHQGARAYADEILARLETELAQVMNDVKNNRMELRQE
ncbi:MAG: ATPase [Firmicutes bacterium]|nr:ATPase [Bacillota bacterium]